jgi:hypothetical protein
VGLGVVANGDPGGQDPGRNGSRGAQRGAGGDGSEAEEGHCLFVAGVFEVGEVSGGTTEEEGVVVTKRKTVSDSRLWFFESLARAASY